MTPPAEPPSRKSAAPWIALGLVFIAASVIATVLLFGLGDDDRDPGVPDPPRTTLGREEAREAASPPFEQGNPRKRQGDHWHVAFGFYVCDAYLPIMEDPGRDPDGIHTHGDGVIHIHPFHGGAAGENAVMARFEEVSGIELDADGFTVPGAAVEAGDDCNGTPGEIRVLVNGREVAGDPSDYRFADRDVVVIALVAPGDQVPPLPWAEVLDNLSDVPAPA